MLLMMSGKKSAKAADSGSNGGNGRNGENGENGGSGQRTPTLQAVPISPDPDPRPTPSGPVAMALQNRFPGAGQG